MGDQNPRHDTKGRDSVADNETAWHGRDRLPSADLDRRPGTSPLDVEAAPRAVRPGTNKR